MNQAGFEATSLSWHMLAYRTQFPTLCATQYGVGIISAPGVGSVSYVYGGGNRWGAREAADFLASGSSWSGPLTLTAEIKVYDTTTTPSTLVGSKTFTSTVSPRDRLSIAIAFKSSHSITFGVHGGDGRSWAKKFQTVERLTPLLGGIISDHEELSSTTAHTLSSLVSWADYRITIVQEHILNEGDSPIVTDSDDVTVTTDWY